MASCLPSPRELRSLLLTYQDAINDPPARQASTSLSLAGFRQLTLHVPNGLSGGVNCGLETLAFHRMTFPRPLQALGQLANWFRFRRWVVRQVQRFQPQLVVSIMLHPLAALTPELLAKNQTRLVACVYDIPPLQDAGKLDRQILRRAWSRLKLADLVWSSDACKAKLAQEQGNLRALPIVCHNCPPQTYLADSTSPRDPWLRQELRCQGAPIGMEGGCVLLRAGAVGEYGGIEETLECMTDLPEDHVFALLGRPPEPYKRKLLARIASLGLERRAFVWDRPTDDTWKQALRGADIGHLIHGPFPPGRMTRLYELNSSLSNNRLFQYMAAALPIISYDDPRMSSIHQEVPCFRVARVSRLRQDMLHILRELGGSNALRKQLGEAGRQAHLAKYNWQYQFQPVLDRIGAWKLPAQPGATHRL